MKDMSKELEKELKVTKLAHAVEKQIMTDNFDKCNTAAEHWKKKCDELGRRLNTVCQVKATDKIGFDFEILDKIDTLETENESLRCCGNCNLFNAEDCKRKPRPFEHHKPNESCPHWTTDGLTRKEREK